VRRTGTMLTAAAVVAASVLAGGAPAASQTADAWQSPQPERIISGSSRPGVGAWGVAYNPVSNELVVSDYVSNQLRRYSPAGVHLGDFDNPKGTTEGVPSAVAVDPSDGSVYLAVTGTGRTSKNVRKYDRTGKFLYDFAVSRSATWLAVDLHGHLWVPEAFASGGRIFEYAVDDATKTAKALRIVDNKGTGPGQTKLLTGVAVDAAGYVYVADPGNGVVHRYRHDGSWVKDFGSKALFKGDMRGVVVDDAARRLYVANSHVGTIEVFDLDGNHVSTISGPGEGAGKFVDGARQLTVTPDGDVWAADYGSHRVQRFSPDGTYRSHFPDPEQVADPAGVLGPRGVAVDPTTGDVLVADGWNQRVQRFTADGRLVQAHGRRGSSTPLGMNYPRSIAVDPATGNVWVANYEGAPHLVVYTPDFSRVVKRIVTPRFVNDIEFADGLVYLVVRSPGSILVLRASDGALVRSCCDTLGLLRGIAVDEATGNLWVTSDTKPEMYVLSPAGALLRTVAVDGRGWGVTISGDVVYVGDTIANKVLAYDRTSYARLGQFGSAGFAPGQLRGPSGVDTDAAGRIYVAEERNARIQVFGRSPVPAAESAAPVLAWTSAAAQTGSPLVVGGSATDASGVALVDVQVRDDATGLFFNGRTAVWGGPTWTPAIAWGPRDSSTWKFTLVPSLPEGSYTVKARATDVHGNVSKPIARTFTVTR
jgi:DNA-binding beta-propeller fold protein YncE